MTRDKLVHLSFSEQEITQLDTYRKKANMTRTEFIRTAIAAHIRAIDNPNLAFGANATEGAMNLILENTKKLLEVQELIGENIADISKKADLIQKIRDLGQTSETQDIALEIITYIEENGPVKYSALTSELGKELDSILSAIAGSDKLTIDNRNMVRIKNDG